MTFTRKDDANTSTHVEDCLVDQAQRIGAEFTALCVQQGIAHDYRVREGEPLQEILAEYATGACQLLIVGGKPLTGLRRFRSRNLPARLETALVSADHDCPFPACLIVRRVRDRGI